MPEASSEIFVNAWDTYRKVVAANHMFHKEIGAELHRILQSKFGDRAFSILDLGCGDAATLAASLTGLRLECYKGVDLAEPVLALAAETLQSLACPVELAHEHVLEALAEDARYDVIHSSFALHHLPTEEKGRFFDLAAQRLNARGLLLLADVVREEGESLDAYYQRYCGWLRGAWEVLDNAEKDLVVDHIVNNDRPEPLSVLRALAAAAGLQIDAAGVGHGAHRLLSFTRA